jgi:hypothetical protein
MATTSALLLHYVAHDIRILPSRSPARTTFHVSLLKGDAVSNAIYDFPAGIRAHSNAIRNLAMMASYVRNLVQGVENRAAMLVLRSAGFPVVSSAWSKSRTFSYSAGTSRRASSATRLKMSPWWTVTRSLGRRFLDVGTQSTQNVA